jgi:hypothetical protein
MSDENSITHPGAGGQNLPAVSFGKYSGMGFNDQTAADRAIPFLGVLQALSPQVTDGDPRRILGAKAGDLFNTVTQELFAQSVTIVPVCTQHTFVEWVPRDIGGGFVAMHAIDSEIVRQAQATAVKFNALLTEAGNDLIETFYLYALLLDGPEAKESLSPIVIAFTSTKIKVYRRLNTTLLGIKSKPPMFAFRLSVTAFDDKNKKGQPFKNFRIEPVNGDLKTSMNLPGGPYAELLTEGAALYRAIKGGTAKAAVESQTTVREAGVDETEPF